MPLRVWNGSSWITQDPLRYWTGSAWADASAGRVWNGSAWIDFLDLDSQVVNVGNGSSGEPLFDLQYGFSNTYSFGTCTDGTSNLYSGAAINDLYWTSIEFLFFNVAGDRANSGWTTMKVDSTSFARTSASYSFDGVNSYWSWATATNPFGTTNGVNKTVIWT